MAWYSKGGTGRSSGLGLAGRQFTSEAKPLYTGALGRFTKQQKAMRSDFQGAESPLQTARTLFEKGGGYGEGQRSLIREEGQKTQATVLSNMVGSGMASGTNFAGATAAINKGMTTQMLQVEDVRTERLSDILKSLTALRAQAAGVMGTTREPDFSSYMGGLSSAINNDTQYDIAAMRGYGGGGSSGGSGSSGSYGSPSTPAAAAASSGGGGGSGGGYTTIGSSLTGGAPEFWGPSGQMSKSAYSAWTA